MNGLKTTIRVFLQFLFLLFRASGERFCFAMRQYHGDFSQSTAQFLNLVGRQRCFSTHPLSALPVEINRGAILYCFILEYRQRLERWPRTGQDGLHLGLLPWRGESSNVGLNQSHDPSHDAVVATNLYCKPQHHPKKLVSHPLLKTAFGHSPGSVCCVLATRSQCASLPSLPEVAKPFLLLAPSNSSF